MSKYYSINEFSRILGVSAQTLRNWDNNGKLHPHHTSSNGYQNLYLTAQGKTFEIISDIGSEINYNKKGLKELIKRISQNKVEKVVVLYKDRLLRFGFELVEYIARKLVRELIEECGEENDKNNQSNVAPK